MDLGLCKLRRVRTESSRRQDVAAQSTVVSAIAQREREYYKNQIASCDGNQGRLFKVMDSLMERESDLILPHSLSDNDLASSLSDFFSKQIKCIRRELDLDLCPHVFSVDFDARPWIITTVLSYFEHIPLQRLQEII